MEIPENADPAVTYQYSLRTLFILIAVLGTITLLVSSCFQVQRKRERELHTWRELTREEWPPRFEEFIQSADQNVIQYGMFDVLYLPWHDCCLIQFENSAELLDYMKSRWRLHSVNQAYREVKHVLANRLPVDLATELQASDVDYYLCGGWITDGKGDQYCVMHDRTNERIVVSYYFNF